MTRVYEDHAYGDGPRQACFWDTFADTPDCPAPEADSDCDVAIIGAGFTGLNAALELARSGVQVAVFDSHQPGWGASGRNGGFCCLGGAAASDAALDRRFGADGRLAYRQAERAAVDYVGDLIAREGIAADTHSRGETYLAHRPKDMKAVRAAATQARRIHGVEPEVFGPGDLAGNGMNGPFHGGLTVPIGFALNPRKYADGLCRAAIAAGARICGNSHISGLRRVAAGFELSINGHKIRAVKVIVATNGYSSDDKPPWLRARYMPTQSSILVTRPLTGSEIASQGWSSHQMAFDTRTLLHYFRLMPDGRFLFGMRGSLKATPAADSRLHRHIRRDFETMFPAWAHVETPHFWSGLVCLMRDLTPFCGLVPGEPGLFAALGYHGNGVAMGSYSGALLADLVQGRKPERPYPAVMAAAPGTFPLGRFRRLIMPPIYMAFGLLDR